MLPDDYDFALRIVDNLLDTLPRLGLTLGNNFWDSALWHARVTGCIAEAGFRAGCRIELGRQFVSKKYRTEVNCQSFLNSYYALFEKYFSKTTASKDQFATEIDVMYLNPVDNTAVGLCEYENERNDILENILKFKALCSSNPSLFKPKLCLLGFYSSSQANFEETQKQLRDFIRKAVNSESISGSDGNAFQIGPLNCYWLLIGIYKGKYPSEEPYTTPVLVQAAIFDSNSNQLMQKESMIGGTEH